MKFVFCKIIYINVLNIKKNSSEIKGGIISLSFFLFMTYFIIPSLDLLRVTASGYVIAEIINAPLLILSIPLYIFYSYIGFGLDAIYNTGVGYESLSVFLLGIIFMKVFNIFYFFFVGVFCIKVYKKVIN